MKKLFLSICIGGIIGSLFAWGVVYTAPRLPDVFATAFFYSSSQTPTQIIQDIKYIFIPSSDQYIINSVDESIATTTKVVYADLNSMHISMFEKGEKIAEYPIQSIGREGTAWQTPLGKFDMSYKTKNHFSSIGEVYMPWSMHFFGNYFIHGWPYYGSGMPVARGYSGGCIRLTTPDAEQVYRFVDKDTELIVTNSNTIDTEKDFEYELAQSAPSLDARFLVVDIETGEVIASKNAQEQISINSFAKLMTGLISIETLNQYQEAVFDQDIIKISDILYPLLLKESDEAGQVLFEHKNKNQYLLDMNTRAQSLGMEKTKYTDVNGLTSSTVSTLEDTFKLLHYIKQYKPFLVSTLSRSEYTIGKSVHEVSRPLKDINSYVAEFSNVENSEAITFFALPISSIKKNFSKEKTFVILVHQSTDAQADTRALYLWLIDNVTLKREE